MQRISPGAKLHDTATAHTHGKGLGPLAGAILIGAAGLAAAGLATRARVRRTEAANPPKGRILRIDGVAMHVLEMGDPGGRPIVFLHGNGAMIDDWLISGVPRLAARSHRCILVDRPGFGHSTRPRDRRWTADRQSELIWKTLDRLGVRQPILVGQSWGTMVGLAMAIDRPAEVSGLVLISGYYFPTPRPDALLFGAPAIPGLGDIFRNTVDPFISRAIAPVLIRAMFSPRPVPEAFKRHWPVDMAVRPSQLLAFATANLDLRESARRICDHYEDLETPTVILAGAKDRLISPDAHARRLARLLLRAEVRILPGEGHMLHHFAQGAILRAVSRLALDGSRHARPAFAPAPAMQ